ncbi:thioredoxin family protein [Pseudoflavitalea rhizosphaerae]|uniref:thioredoxin family protein n=1 Tax=Pseudoflavitalea rhizosphaerae TaxID=1884793 RepID=UPI000F8C8B6C|nr:thioredoxin family protein [Pseudoflavitalea rhizosphaerae]
MITTNRNVLDRKYLDNAMDYPGYRKLVDELLLEGKVTGPQQSESLAHYTKLNVQRMQRIDKTVQLLPEVSETLRAISKPQTWLVITEGWCGDAAQILPVLNAMAGENPLVQLKLVLRDENTELIDQYLTDGTSRSIPKLVVLDTETLEEKFNWGPRPAPLQELYKKMRTEGMDYVAIAQELHAWYAKDKTIHTQKEILKRLIES